MENNYHQAFEKALEKTSEGQLAIDVIETKNDIVIVSAIAGISPKDLDITVNNDMVTIRGSRSKHKQHSEGTVHYEEVFWGNFSRSIILPVNVQPSEAKATFEDGILRLTIPKVHGEMKIKL